MSEPKLYMEFWLNGNGMGVWVTPPREWVDGKDAGRNEIRPNENLYALRNTGDFADTFTTVNNGTALALWYWSSTELSDSRGRVWNVGFSNGGAATNFKDGYRLSSRPCLVELAI